QPKLNPQDEVVDPLSAQAEQLVGPIFDKFSHGDSRPVMHGVGLWTSYALPNTLGSLLGFGKIMVILAIAATLPTRLAMPTNILICGAIFGLGHLAPVLRRVSDRLRAESGSTAFKLVNFITQLLEAVTPSLQFYDMGPAIIRDTPISIGKFSVYVASSL